MVFSRILCSEIEVFEWRNECDFKLNNNLDIWRVYIPDYIKKINQEDYLLDDFELDKSNSFLREEDRNRYVLSKICLKKLIANYLKINPEDIEFRTLELNKPVLASHSNLEFNISHSGDFIIIGITKRFSLGVDIEFMDAKVDLYNLIYNTMSSLEVSSILNSGSPREMFYKHWTRKEALLKGIGIGLTDRLKDINCCDGKNLVPSDLSSFASSWDIRNFIMNDEYAVSLAYDTAIRVLRFYEFRDN
ncbi:4'-phosphopantetheinyl transferase superfamily protein [Algoriphagus sp.]|uniref:4'-phosphopantetheinyl transferase family protein n=1 Tax=Algoriphagus sp. TaxID=1872435 RepID=UPI0025F73A1F|nr:4'-phosphopantetheinyl transferase superfamily protein [Algoriphagus sp.]